jgi:GPI mannosyltransferase 3
MERLHRFHALTLAVTVVIHLVTAWNSSGFHSADEHHQIIAFAEHAKGTLPSDQLAWEHAYAMRSSLLPWLAWLVMQLPPWAPHWTTLLLRLATMLTALLLIRASVRVVLPGLAPQWQRPFILLSHLCWFLPFLSVRFSSETWSGLLLLAACSVLAAPQRARYWAAQLGSLLALAVLVRPTTTPVALGMVIWLLLVRREPWRQLLLVSAAVLLTTAGGILLDTLFYGRPVFSPFHYVQVAIQGPPHGVFDTLPWYYYLPWILKYALPPIGAAILVALFMLLLKRPRHLLSFCIVPYLIMLSMVPHKEVRFLYPLAFLVPWLLCTGLPLLPRWPHWFGVVVVTLTVAVNAIGLAVVMSAPAGMAQEKLAAALPDPAAPLTFLSTPEDAWRIMPPHSHRRPLAADRVVDPHGGVVPDGLVIADAADMALVAGRHGVRTELVQQGDPQWVRRLLKAYRWHEGRSAPDLYHVKSDAAPRGKS